MYKYLLFLFSIFLGYGTFDAVTPGPGLGQNIAAERGAVTSMDTLTGPVGGSDGGDGGDGGGGG